MGYQKKGNKFGVLSLWLKFLSLVRKLFFFCEVFRKTILYLQELRNHIISVFLKIYLKIHCIRLKDDYHPDSSASDLLKNRTGHLSLKPINSVQSQKNMVNK